MSLPVEIPGLDTLVPQLPEGKLVVVESGADPAKSYFIRRLCLSARARGLPLTFVTSRDREELLELLDGKALEAHEEVGPVEIVARDSVDSLDEYGDRGGLLAVDSFSFLTLDRTPVELAGLLRDLRAMCRRHGLISVLGTDRGMFEARAEAITVHLADGLFQFHAKEGPEGLMRYLRIPKWLEGRFVDRNIYYDYDGRRMAIDLRKRVI